MCEVLVEDIGYEEIGIKVEKPQEGIKIAGYVGCQTGSLRHRPLLSLPGRPSRTPSTSTSWSTPWGGESIPTYEKKVQCCGGALSIVEPEKSQEMIKGTIESA